MGKTQSGAVWLDAEKTSPYEFYQYWRNVSDADVLKCLRMLTFLPLEQIEEMDKWEGSKLNDAKDILAYELTALVHGEEEAGKARQSSRAVFGSGNAEDMPTMELDASLLQDDSLDLISALVAAELVPSRAEGRRAIQQGGVSVDGERISDIAYRIAKDKLDDGVVLKKGKKSFKRVVLQK